MPRVLIVADAAPAREVMALALAREGPHTVRSVAPGDLRIANAREWSPDIIIMDLATDGAALPLRIGMLRDPELATVPFIALGDSEDEARALGAHAFVRIPPPLKGLVQLVGRFAAMRAPLPA